MRKVISRYCTFIILLLITGLSLLGIPSQKAHSNSQFALKLQDNRISPDNHFDIGRWVKTNTSKQFVLSFFINLDKQESNSFEDDSEDDLKFIASSIIKHVAEIISGKWLHATASLTALISNLQQHHNSKFFGVDTYLQLSVFRI